MVVVDGKNRICTREFKERMIKTCENYKSEDFVSKTNFVEKDKIAELKKENIKLKKENVILKQVILYCFMNEL